MKKVLVYGLGISGVSTVNGLSKYSLDISILDNRSREELTKELKRIEGRHNLYLNGNKPNLRDFDLIIKSPGIKPDNKILKEAREYGLDIITDLELAYLLYGMENSIVITGTNGKTTTTKLISNILSLEYENTKTLGNIGVGILEGVNDKKGHNVIEASSFQLHGTKEFHSKIGVILNLTPDHLDWHKDLKDYYNSKFKLMKNQKENEFIVLNYDDQNIRNNYKKYIGKGKIFWFSQEKELKEGAYYSDNSVFINWQGTNIQIPIKNNTIIKENLLAAISATYLYNISIKNIIKGINTFEPLKHRIEYVKTINEVDYFNDSKGTNPEATIQAIKTLEKDIILIAGGYDKGSSFKELGNFLKGRVDKVILMGETSKKMKEDFLKSNYKNIKIVNNMEEAVKLSKEVSKKGNKVLLSPACASWGLYKNYEERGIDFINLVNKED